MAGLLLLAALALPASAIGQQDGIETDGRWMAFVGCWEAVGAEEEIGLLCFAPVEGGVELTNYAAGEPVSSELFVADGQDREVAAEGCEGTESVSFSEDGRRVFTETEFSCGQDIRTGTGVMAFTAPNYWVDVRVLEVDGEDVAWVQRYRLASIDRLAEEGIEDPARGLGMAVRSARMAAAAPIRLDDVEEAAGRMGPEAVESWIVAQGDPFEVDADALVRLDDAGISHRVIDAVVAVSHPDLFVMEAGGPERVTDRPRPTHYRGYMAFRPWWRPGFGYRGYYGYDRFGPLGYSPYASPFRSLGYGYGFGYWGTRPGYISIQRRSSSDRGGRVIKGRGYRQGGAATGRSARPRGGAQPSYSTGGSDRGGQATRSGGDRGRRDTGRKAKRRGGSGG